MALSKFSNLTILLADDHPLFRKGLRSVIRSLGFIGLVLEAGNGKEVLQIKEENLVDLYILDYKMPELDGYDTSMFILKKDPRAKIIIITMYDNPPLVANFHKIGIMGFMNKNTDPDRIETGILTVLNGWEYYESVEKELGDAHPIQFTHREKELIALLAKGLTSQAISQNLGLAYKTIETYRSRLLEKVSARNTSELLHYVHRIGLI
jgi:DNA-binding NarL/FixJ family response regulator